MANSRMNHRRPVNGARIVSLGHARSQAPTSQAKADAVVRLTDQLYGDDRPRWGLVRVRERVTNSWVSTAIVQSLALMALSGIAVGLVIWALLVLVLSL
jgi:hypothetical protein